jgi:hypothetical protein
VKGNNNVSMHIGGRGWESRAIIIIIIIIIIITCQGATDYASPWQKIGLLYQKIMSSQTVCKMYFI